MAQLWSEWPPGSNRALLVVQVAEHLAYRMHVSKVTPDEDCLASLAAAAAIANIGPALRDLPPPQPHASSLPEAQTPGYGGPPLARGGRRGWGGATAAVQVRCTRVCMPTTVTQN